jgi:hypothetical protein
MLKSVKSAEANNPIRTCCWSCNFEALEELFFFKHHHGYLKAQWVREVAIHHIIDVGIHKSQFNRESKPVRISLCLHKVPEQHPKSSPVQYTRLSHLIWCQKPEISANV